MPMPRAAQDRNFLRYMNAIKQYPLLTKAEEQAVARKYVNTGRLQFAHQLVNSNLRFVAKVAYKYANTGHEMMDLIQEGNEGLMHAVRKFDPDRGYRLISYAVHWIKAYLNRYIITNHSQVKMGTTQAQRMLFFKLRTEKAKVLAQRNNESEVTNEEMAEMLGCHPHEIQDMEVRLAQRDFSLQGELSQSPHMEGHTTFQDRLVDNRPDQLAQVETHFAAEKIRDLISQLKLNEKEHYIVYHRLMNTDPETLQEIGDKFDVSRERIRQIEANLKHKIKAAIMREDRKVPGSSILDEGNLVGSSSDESDTGDTGVLDFQAAEA